MGVDQSTLIDRDCDNLQYIALYNPQTNHQPTEVLNTADINQWVSNMAYPTK